MEALASVRGIRMSQNVDGGSVEDVQVRVGLARRPPRSLCFGVGIEVSVNREEARQRHCGLAACVTTCLPSKASNAAPTTAKTK